MKLAFALRSRIHGCIGHNDFVKINHINCDFLLYCNYLGVIIRLLTISDATWPVDIPSPCY